MLDGKAVSIRFARSDEMDAVARLYWSVCHETQAPLQPATVAAFRDERFFTRRVTDLPQAPLVAIAGGRIVGFGGWTGRQLGQLFVAAEGRASGIGATLLAASERAMAESGQRQANLLVLRGNDRARRFYERHGWTVVSATVSDAATFDGPVPVEALEMTKDLIGAL